MSSEPRIVETSIFQTVAHEAPAHTGATEIARTIIDRIKEMSIGSGVEYRIASDVSGSGVRHKAMYLATSEGIGVTMRFRSGVLRVWRVEPKAKRHGFRDREAQIIARRMEGETLESIAADFRLTRERVRQISAGYSTFRELPVSERIQAVNDYSAPFIEATLEVPRCIVCKQESVGRRLRGVCTECGKLVQIICNAANRIREYKNTGNRHRLAMANVLIRKYNLTPEDLGKG